MTETYLSKRAEWAEPSVLIKLFDRGKVSILGTISSKYSDQMIIQPACAK